PPVHRDLHSFPTRRSSDLFFVAPKAWGNTNYAAGIFWNDTQGTPYYTPANGTGIDIFGVQRAAAGLPIRRADQYEYSRSEPYRRSEEHTSELQSRGHLVCR